MDKRKSERHEIRFEVAYIDKDGYMSGPVINISETGCFIETTMPLDEGANVRITPLLPGELGMYEIEGTIARKNDYNMDKHYNRTAGMGIHFKKIEKKMLDELLAAFNKN